MGAAVLNVKEGGREELERVKVKEMEGDRGGRVEKQRWNHICLHWDQFLKRTVCSICLVFRFISWGDSLYLGYLNVPPDITFIIARSRMKTPTVNVSHMKNRDAHLPRAGKNIQYHLYSLFNTSLMFNRLRRLTGQVATRKYNWRESCAFNYMHEDIERWDNETE